MHHAAAIATLCNKFGLQLHSPLAMTARSDLTNAINLAEHTRQVCDWPETTPQYVPPNPEAGGPFSPEAGMAPLTPPAHALMGLLVKTYGRQGDPIPTTYDQAYEVLQRLGSGLFR